MTIENETKSLDLIDEDIERDILIKSLTDIEEICFKSQQKWENDLSRNEKFEIGLELFKSNKLQFLMKFGKYLKHQQLNYFRKATEQESNFEEINILVNDLIKNLQGGVHNMIVKNRRYQAMVQMIQESTYFSEVEMMKRNPLLYNQLIGKYLTSEEVKERDKYEMNNKTSFVKILMEGIERDNAEEIRQQEEQMEKNQMEEEDEDLSDKEQSNYSLPKPSTSHWGEFEGSKKTQIQKSTYITPEEQKLLKDEFVTTMYESFLDGRDTDFDYEAVDNDTTYDDMDEIDNDEEEKYFASEEACESRRDNECSEDELDVYMNTLR